MTRSDGMSATAHPIRPTRRGFAALALGLAATALARPVRAALPPEQTELVRRIEDYFNSIDTLKSSFSQVNPDGSLATGVVFIDRQRGAMRFDYDPPSKILLIAPGDWRLVFYDGSIQQVNVLPVAQTPLGFILNRNVELSGDITIEHVQEREGEVHLTLTRTDARDQGNVVLTFSKSPIALKRWAVTDPQGLVTHILLEDVRTGMPIDRDLFVWNDPQMFGFPKDD